MNREQAAKLLPIIQAWVEGKEIECKSLLNPNPHWFPIMIHDNHDFSHNWEYRIKSEVKEGWINIYPPEDNMFYQNRTLANRVIGNSGGVYLDEEMADIANEKNGNNRVACIKITYTEGEGL